VHATILLRILERLTLLKGKRDGLLDECRMAAGSPSARRCQGPLQGAPTTSGSVRCERLGLGPQGKNLPEWAKKEGGSQAALQKTAVLLGMAFFQCPFKARDQAFLADGFGEEGKRSALQCGRAHVLLGIRRHEDGGNVMASAEQPPLQIDATDTRHAHVRDQARGILQSLGAQKFFGRRKRCRQVAVGFQKASGRLANRQVIIDDRNKWIFDQ
jgi:hypothetical protein